MKNTPPFVPELSRPLSVDRIPNGGMEEHVVARPDERKALSERFDLVRLTKLEARLNIDLVKAGKMVLVKGFLDADVVQQCVVTLEPVASHVHAEIKTLFGQAAFLELGAGGAMHNDLDDEEPPEPIIGNAIDIGEVVSQHLAMALDPYPRLPGAALPDAVEVDAEPVQEKPVNPFAKLKSGKVNFDKEGQED